MNIQNNIEKKLLDHFEPAHLEVINESFMHNVPDGAETHFKVVLVTPKFSGERLINRHRAVNAVLKDELANEIHALALHTYTDEEWHSLYGEAPDSPRCLGGMHRQAS
ncbi:BolA/IbaG family iron-sulfur metabolism protein [Aestuariibacter halophilus]|uniref:BolA/IbaG family iron-sulfur metabolism protein n=1 Tax=Fluctibacter halophilus TaxID=226011 RepID=A0ABS8GCD7_9ALTE|nr:BolA/IbaG family iron-sulfur metabolism protein [Aestuariibacter halophilus]MCC2617906.1 BolA/IbaG family iron-sulfur metabolism protein [Aestuariibacter halophilus]